MQNKMVPVCKLYENVSKTTGKRYFSGNLSFSSKLLIFRDDRAKEGEPGWTLFISDREPKVQAGNSGGTLAGDDSSMERRKTA